MSFDRRASESLDRWLTTPPEDGAPVDDVDGCEYCGMDRRTNDGRNWDCHCEDLIALAEREDAEREQRELDEYLSERPSSGPIDDAFGIGGQE